jgi:hypothetical protein
VAKTRRNEIDWAELQAKVDNIRVYSPSFKVASEEDIAKCKLSDMTHNQVACDCIGEWRSRELIAVLDPEKRDRMQELADNFGFELTHSSEGKWIGGAGHPRWERLDELIRKKVLNDELMELWGLLNFYHAIYMELYLGNEEIYKREFHQCMMAQGDATLIQRHWYAHWLHNAKTKRSLSLDEARSELIHLIESVRAGKRKPPAPYDVDWYVSMLETKKRAGSSIPSYTGDLKTSYTRQTWAEIGRLVKDPLITRHVLPPLSVNGFELA